MKNHREGNQTYLEPPSPSRVQHLSRGRCPTETEPCSACGEGKRHLGSIDFRDPQRSGQRRFAQVVWVAVVVAAKLFN